MGKYIHLYHKTLSYSSKKAVRIITFSNFKAHTNNLFFRPKILKFHDIVTFNTALFMHDYHQGKLPIIFHHMFALVSESHHYNTRLASKSSYCIPLIRTYYGKFSPRFQGPKIWNAIDKCIK